jgi:Ca2+-binding EF-hand superfamily protein
LAPAGPLLLDLYLQIDGQPHGAALAKLVDKIRRLADADHDGRTTWKEIAAAKQIKYGQFGNLPIPDPNAERQVVETYDIDRDGEADESELPRFLTRNAGGARPFSVRGTLDFRDLNRRGSPTWRLLDADDDGVLSAAERAAAAARLASRDADDDEILLPGDLAPQRDILAAEGAAERRPRGPPAVRLLGPHADWSAVQLALEQTYSGVRSLRADSFPLFPELFAQLDANGDGRLRREEFPRLNAAPPHLVLAVEFGARPGKSAEAAAQAAQDDSRPANDPPQCEASVPLGRLRLLRADPGLLPSRDVVQQQPDRLIVPLAGVLVTVYTNDAVAAENHEARAQQALAMFDANRDGYLVPDEVPESLAGQLGRFEALDADDDGKAYAGEIATFLAQQQAGLRAQIHARVSDEPDALFAVLDANHDGRLDSRELEAAAERLAQLDRQPDGQITPDELPEVILVALARGSLENADATFAAPAATPPATAGERPRWFTATDANGDDAISRREFLGTPAQYQQLDANANGLLEPAEAASAAGP